MSFKISIISGSPQYYPLPVAVIKHFSGNSAVQPFTQASFCVNEKGFIADMWTFELNRAYDSIITAVFSFSENVQDKLLAIDVLGDNSVKCSAISGGKPQCEVDFSSRELSGEDLQGIFGGAEVCVSSEAINKLFGASLKSCGKIYGNIYKYCKSKDSLHFGSFYKTHGDFGDIYKPEFLGSFELVRY
ncbi:MAG TPA: hypothetical protein DCP97_05240 [Ruminococcaceae bacterium]|nr:hypothetical protein [Oscillospiraceae bacterium]